FFQVELPLRLGGVPGGAPLKRCRHESERDRPRGVGRREGGRRRDHLPLVVAPAACAGAGAPPATVAAATAAAAVAAADSRAAAGPLPPRSDRAAAAADAAAGYIPTPEFSLPPIPLGVPLAKAIQQDGPAADKSGDSERDGNHS
ncbi:unnamed protein product, partial [Ectocarpus sp. 12 AP-2014]